MITTQPPSPSSFQSTSTTSPARSPRRPSISKPMSWLARTSASSPSSHGHSHSSGGGSNTIHISEPKLVSDSFTPTGGTMYTQPRYGVLGMGATVVRTPQDALARAMLIQAQQPYPPQDPPSAEEDDDQSSYEEPEPASPGSPALPPLPFSSKSSPHLPSLSELEEFEHPSDTPSPTRTRPNRPPPAAPQIRPVLKTSPTSPLTLPAVPSLPLNITPTPPQPSFTPILLAPVPDSLFEFSSLLVTLETSTSSMRTTYATLISRPSHLADYLKSLSHSAREREKRKFRDTLVEVDDEFEDEEDDGQRLSSPNTPFSSLFAAHLASTGLIPPSAGMIHLFLDRPSAPYAHILTYLRSPPTIPTLPRSATLGSRHAHSYERLEALLELRDEAKYLGLDELHKLCCDEIRQRQGHVRGGGSNISGGTASGSGQVVILGAERGRDAGLVRLGAVVPQTYKCEGKERNSTGSSGCASATSEVAHVEGVPVSPTAPASVRAMSPGHADPRSRSRSRNPHASDWI